MLVWLSHQYLKACTGNPHTQTAVTKPFQLDSFTKSVKSVKAIVTLQARQLLYSMHKSIEITLF